MPPERKIFDLLRQNVSNRKCHNLKHKNSDEASFMPPANGEVSMQPAGTRPVPLHARCETSFFLHGCFTGY